MDEAMKISFEILNACSVYKQEQERLNKSPFEHVAYWRIPQVWRMIMNFCFGYFYILLYFYGLLGSNLYCWPVENWLKMQSELLTSRKLLRDFFLVFVVDWRRDWRAAQPDAGHSDNIFKK